MTRGRVSHGMEYNVMPDCTSRRPIRMPLDSMWGNSHIIRHEGCSVACRKIPMSSLPLKCALANITCWLLGYNMLVARVYTCSDSTATNQYSQHATVYSRVAQTSTLTFHLDLQYPVSCGRNPHRRQQKQGQSSLKR